MGKRSNFKRRKHDAYDTPIEAVVPLVEFIERDDDFLDYWEPCAGKGDLIRHTHKLSEGGFSCKFASDIAPRLPSIDTFDPLTAGIDICQAYIRDHNVDVIITNPPWTRQILHPMIELFSSLRPTWLLFDADWMHTKQARPYLEYCTDIVSVGRVKWIPNSKHTGKDNVCWYCFDQTTDERKPTIFHAGPKRITDIDDLPPDEIDELERRLLYELAERGY